MQFFLKTGENIQGPFSRDQIVSFVNAKKLGGQSLVAESANGPFLPLSQSWESISNPQATQQPSFQAAPTQVTCTVCSSLISEDASHCPLCKTPLGSGSIPSQIQPPLTTAAGLPDQTSLTQDYYAKQFAAAQASGSNQNQQTANKKTKKKRTKADRDERKKIIIGVGIAGGLLLILLVAIVLSYALAGPPREYKFNAENLEDTADWIQSLDETKAIAKSYKINPDLGRVQSEAAEQEENAKAIAEKLKPLIGTKVRWKMFLWEDWRKGDYPEQEFGNALNVGSKGVNTQILFRVRAKACDPKIEYPDKHSLKKELWTWAKMPNSSPDYIQLGEAFELSGTIAEVRAHASAFTYASTLKTIPDMDKRHMKSTLKALEVNTPWAELIKGRSKAAQLLTSNGHFGAFVDIILKIDEDWRPSDNIIKAEAKDRTFFAQSDRANSPAAKAKRQQFRDAVVETITGQSNQNNSPNRTSFGNSGSSSRQTYQTKPTLSESEIVNKIGTKLGFNKTAFDVYKRQIEHGEIRGNLKPEDVPGAFAQLEKFALKPSLDQNDAVAIASLINEIDFARGKRRKSK
ncbi:MAG: hypothetical protein VX768_11855 [Planctomycetota bacterium]|nr:hypothetical protein [Planctomycetota bacterium]